MQTFLPLADFTTTAMVLDDERLGKQRVECLQILRSLTYESYGWKSHPAVLQWKHHEKLLTRYLGCIVVEWVNRGFEDNIWYQVNEEFSHLIVEDNKPIPFPWWVGFESYHLSHRSNLIRKLPAHYGVIWPSVPDDLPYYWPSHHPMEDWK